MLCAIYRAVLSSGTAETEHEVCEFALHVTGYMGVCQFIYMREEFCYLAVLLKEIYNLLVKPGKVLEVVIFARVVDCTAVKYVSSAVSAGVTRNAFLV